MLFTLEGSLITCHSKKQSMATCSSVEVEFKATIQGIFKEALCIKGILSYL